MPSGDRQSLPAWDSDVNGFDVVTQGTDTQTLRRTSPHAASAHLGGGQFPSAARIKF